MTLEHQLVEADGGLRCTACGRTFNSQPKLMIECPGAPIYQWQPWPADLYTAKQIKEKGMLPGELRGVIPYSKAADGSGYLKLYRLDEATPKPPRTPAQLAGAAKALAARTCKRCGRAARYKKHLTDDGLCQFCHAKVWPVAWARQMLTSDAVILDTETSGLSSDDEIIAITVINLAGEVLLDTLVKPQVPIVEVEEEEYDEDDWNEREYGPARTAFGVNGITNAMVADAPAWDEVAAQLYPLLAGRIVIAYNAEFDERMIIGNCARHDIPSVAAGDWHCLMLAFSDHFGEWSDYHDDFKYQSLWTARMALVKDDAAHVAHTSAGDCFTSLAVLRALAALNP